jgi:hypothetical protein
LYQFPRKQAQVKAQAILLARREVKYPENRLGNLRKTIAAR